MAPGIRKFISPKSKKFNDRFALHFRSLMDGRGLTPIQLKRELRKLGLVISRETITKWMNGSNLPRPDDMERVAAVLRLRDYRHLFPPGLK